jgi:hypothetical protein
VGECRHLFVRLSWWWLRRNNSGRWQCVRCGDLSRTWDGVDSMAGRPVHPHLAVALPGYNTLPGRVRRG